MHFNNLLMAHFDIINALQSCYMYLSMHYKYTLMYENEAINVVVRLLLLKI